MTEVQPKTTQHRTPHAIALGVFRHSDAEYGIITAYKKLSHSANCREHGRNLAKRYDVDSIPQTSGIYQILCVPTGKVYVGSAKNIAHRWNVHKKRLRANRHENTYLQAAWNKYGADAFTFQVIESVDECALLVREQYWMDNLQSCNRDRGFNISTRAGAPMAGRKHTPETLQRLSQANTGRHHTEETKRMMSERNKGRRFGTQTPESLRKHAESMRGFRHTPESIEKMRQSARRVQTSAREFIITTPDGAVLRVINLSRFCEDNGLSRACMQQVARGYARQHKGYTCAYPDRVKGENVDPN